MWENVVSRGLSLVLPAYNEEAGIAQAIAEADAALRRITRRYEILVVDDGSSDATHEHACRAAETYPAVRVLRHETNFGYGAALRTGFEAARHELVSFTDADCQFDLLDLVRMVPLTDDYPVVVGYRMDRKDPWLRLIYSWTYNRIIRVLLGTGVRDVDCALKVFRADAVRRLLPETNGFFVNTEMLARAKKAGLAVTEVGVTHRPRAAGTSKVSWRDIPKILRVLVPFWWGLAVARQGDARKIQLPRMDHGIPRPQPTSVHRGELMVESRS